MKTQRLIPQSKLICGDCKHFCQHYGRDERGYYPIACGHCTFPRVKHRVRDQTCPHWAPRERETGQ